MDGWVVLVLAVIIFIVGLIAGAGLSDHEKRIRRLEIEGETILREMRASAEKARAQVVSRHSA